MHPDLSLSHRPTSYQLLPFICLGTTGTAPQTAPSAPSSQKSISAENFAKDSLRAKNILRLPDSTHRFQNVNHIYPSTQMLTTPFHHHDTATRAKISSLEIGKMLYVTGLISHHGRFSGGPSSLDASCVRFWAQLP